MIDKLLNFLEINSKKASILSKSSETLAKEANSQTKAFTTKDAGEAAGAA